MKTKMKSYVLALTCITAIFLALPVFADNGGKNNNQIEGRRNGPPPEAYTACESKSIGESSQFVDPNGETVTGICEQEGDQIVLRPNDHPKRNDMGRRQGPPPEAYMACEGKNEGDSAQFTSPRGETVKGICEVEKNVKLVLRPERP